ncbi:MAG: EVE domain-containing protein, partial [Burkholderiales bacterium]|nr:EVE domain-containing protein [Burkholderiales bacterium]
SKYYDAKASRENPRWLNIDVKLTRKTRLLSLKELRDHPELAGMRILRKGNRLSVTPVDPREWHFIIKLLGAA